jgi:2-oxo-4-hydroxy-4-carboxy--5-ureidoimidazoline (OHCU) decarboxylase
MWITQHYPKGLSTFLVDYTTLHQGTINLSCGLHNTTPRNPQTFLWITQHYTKGPSTFLVDYTTLHQGTINLSCGLHNTTSRDHQPFLWITQHYTKRQSTFRVYYVFNYHLNTSKNGLCKLSIYTYIAIIYLYNTSLG